MHHDFGRGEYWDLGMDGEIALKEVLLLGKYHRVKNTRQLTPHYLALPHAWSMLRLLAVPSSGKYCTGLCLHS